MDVTTGESNTQHPSGDKTQLDSMSGTLPQALAAAFASVPVRSPRD